MGWLNIDSEQQTRLGGEEQQRQLVAENTGVCSAELRAERDGHLLWVFSG